MRYKGIVHLHSKYSYDSNLRIEKIVEFALKNQLNFIILSDHDSIAGSLQLKKIIEQNKLNIIVPVAAEYKTTDGDLIALFIKKEITTKNTIDFVNEVRKQNGLVFLPHPYKGHKHIDELAGMVDAIEIFNSRNDHDIDAKASQLANKLNKPYYYSSDAHLYTNLKDCIIGFQSPFGLKKALLTADVRPINLYRTNKCFIIYTQIIKAIKNKDYKLLLKSICYFIINGIKA